MAGIVGKIGSLGVPITLPPAGVGPLYVVPAGRVTVPDTVPPPIRIFPLTSMFPEILALEPVRRIFPVAPNEFAAEILPFTILLLLNSTVPPEYMLLPIVAFPVDFTSRKLPTDPPCTLEEDPKITPQPGAGGVDIPLGQFPVPPKITKSEVDNC
jgi:hypothetical protein